MREERLGTRSEAKKQKTNKQQNKNKCVALLWRTSGRNRFCEKKETERRNQHMQVPTRMEKLRFFAIEGEVRYSLRPMAAAPPS